MVFHEGHLQEFCEEWRHLDAVPGQSNCWLKELGPRQFPILSVNGLVASQFSRNADPLAAWTGTGAEKTCLFFPVAFHLAGNHVMASEPHVTWAHSERGRTVAQQVHFKSLWDRLSEVEHFDVSWKQISVRDLAQVGEK